MNIYPRAGSTTKDNLFPRCLWMSVIAIFRQPRGLDYNFGLRKAGELSMRSLLAILLVVCPLICVAQEAESPRIRPGDHVHISVRREPDLTVSEVVSGDGFIFLPLVNRARVAGLTVQEAQRLLSEKLQRFVANPEVTVTILNRQELQTLIRPGDYLHISVRTNPDFTVSEVVSSDGFISLPLINGVKVAGLTVEEAQRLLSEKLERFVAKPEVTVTITNRPKPQMLPSMGPFMKADRSLIVAEHAG